MMALIFVCCSNPEQCTKSSGALIIKNFDYLTFDKILVFKGINIVIIEGATHKVSVQSGTNLIDDIDVRVVNGQLQLKDNTTCNWVREFTETIITITTPTLKEIYSKTEGTITTVGKLTFPNLKLIALDNFDGLGGAGTGDFTMDLNCENVEIENNHVANFTLSGHTAKLNISIYEGNGKINSENLVAQNVQISHRGSNSVRVKAIQSLTGNIYNIGHVYCYSQPIDVRITEHYRGKLIYK